MQVAPDADPSDGRLNVVELGDLSALGSIITGLHFYGKGRPPKGLRRWQITRATVTPADGEKAMPLEMDGEARGFAPATFEILPAALRLVTQAPR